MIVPDINLLVYAYDETSPFHGKSKVWWEEALNGSELVGIPWAVSLGFLRLSTSRQVFVLPLPLEDALEIVSGWYSQSVVRPVQPGDRHFELFTAALRDARAGGKLITDAHLAAIAMEHRATIHSHDRDFQRFSGLLLHDPLA